MSTLTSANSTLAIAVDNLYVVPQTIEGFAVDDAFTAEAVDQAEVLMGVDGKLSAGFVFNPTKMTITLQADSPSLSIFTNWGLAQSTAREVYFCNATVGLPAIGKKYTLQRGVLTNVKQMPDVKKILQPIPFIITFEKIISEDA